MAVLNESKIGFLRPPGKPAPLSAHPIIFSTSDAAIIGTDAFDTLKTISGLP